jgi:ubiquinone/menaquinone biosynthesis C-methylase UbiE
MTKYFKLVTAVFILTLPFLIILLFLPMTVINFYLKLWKRESEKRVEKMNAEQRKEDYTNNRIKDLSSLLRDVLPKDAKTSLDIGAGRALKNKFLKKYFEKYISLDIKNADINQDLSKEEKIPLKDNSVDIVIMSNILEHLADPLPTIIEANRITKKYLLIGLPNEFPLDARLFVLFGLNYDKVYPLGHKHKLSIYSVENFIKSIFGGYIKKKYKFNMMGERFIPNFIKKRLIILFPSLFVGEIFYLLKKQKIDTKNILSYEYS